MSQHPMSQEATRGDRDPRGGDESRGTTTRRETLKGIGAATLMGGLFGSRAFARERRILFYTKSSGFQHPVIRQVNGASFAEGVLRRLGSQYGFEIEATKDGSVFDRSLDDYDAFLFYTTGDLLTAGQADGAPPMTAKGKKRLFREIQKRGKGFVGVHSASDTFHSPGERFAESTKVDPYIEMLGGEFVTHGAPQKARMRVVDSTFPGLQKLGGGFEMHEEWYSLKNYHPDIHVLLVQETSGMEGPVYERPPYPATWLRNYGAGRVFYTSMGHGEAVWESTEYQQILLGGIFWALRDTEADTSANLESFAPRAKLSVYPPKN